MGPDWRSLGLALATASGLDFHHEPAAAVGGGCINECLRWETASGPAFVKLATRDRLSMFEAESEGLRELAAAAAVRVPQVLGVGGSDRHAFIALEWLELGGRSRRAGHALGEQLARLHRVRAEKHGWHRDNTIGATPQHNEPCADWPRFFAERRLGFQLDLAARNGHRGPLIERGRRLCERLDDFFVNCRPAPSLLHGDLWGGNWAVTVSGEPVVFDPAVYYGDREADLAMTRLFGGFGPEFYAAYEAAWPLDPGAGTRVALYNLYHVLNHLNLFGGGYCVQALGMIDRLLAE